MNLPIIICDIDGVLADCSHRLIHISDENKDWNQFFLECTKDAPIKRTIQFIQALSNYFEIVYVTGRPDSIRQETITWFEQHHVPFYSFTHLFMRGTGDRREDFIVKRELFKTWIDQTRVIAVIEDRDQVVEMWRAEGLLCLQNKKGDY